MIRSKSLPSLRGNKENGKARAGAGLNLNLERETGFEPATSTLARSHSTTELLPLVTALQLPDPSTSLGISTRGA